jgi:hypothetical protein
MSLQLLAKIAQNPLWCPIVQVVDGTKNSPRLLGRRLSCNYGLRVRRTQELMVGASQGPRRLRSTRVVLREFGDSAPVLQFIGDFAPYFSNFAILPSLF